MANYYGELRLRKVFRYGRRLWVQTWRSGYLRLVLQLRIGRYYFCVVKLESHEELIERRKQEPWYTPQN
jgi:hypothetical protein